MIGAEFITRRNETPAQRARRERDKIQRVAKAAANKADFEAAYQREQDANTAYKKAKDTWLHSAQGQQVLRNTTEIELEVRTPFCDVLVTQGSSGFATTGTTWESKTAGARFGVYSSSYDGMDSWSLEFDGERTGGERQSGAAFVLKCQKGKGYLTQRQRDVIMRLVSASTGPKSFVIQRWYDYNEVDELYRKFGS